MRIFQIITLSDLGGAQSVVVNLANRLCWQHEVFVIAGEGDGKIWNLLDSRVNKLSIRSLKRNISFVDEIKTLFSFIRINKEYAPDLIHLHSSKAGLLGRLAFPMYKTIYTVHGFDSIRVAHRKYLPLERILQQRCSAIVGVSYYDKKHLLKEGIINHVSVVYNGIEKPFSLESDSLGQIEGYAHKILCVARLSPQKNVGLFLEIATMLPQYAFIWIGNQQECAQSFPTNVFFMGSLPNAGAYNKYADLFILPSNYEGLPITIIEAMSFGKPVIASAVGGISEIVINDENGYTVKNTADAFVEKIEYILKNQEVYNRFSKNALDYYQKNLTVDKMVEGYLKIYKSIQSEVI